MALSQRERNISIGVALAVLVLALDLLALQPYLDRRAELVDERDAKRQALREARETLATEAQLRGRLAPMAGAMNADASAAEGRLLHLLHDWEQQSSLSGTAFGRVRSVDQHGLTRLTFEVSATGGMAGVASLIHRVETAPIPLRIDALRITSAVDSGQELRVELDLSTLCQSTAARAPLAMRTEGMGP